MTSNPPVFDHQFEEESWFHHAMQMQMPVPSQGQEDQHRSKRPRFSNFPPMDTPHQNPNPSANPTPSIFFKTRPCKMFDQGHCPHGRNCTFAHGPQDLRQPPPNWREFVARDSSTFADRSSRVCGGERSSHGDNSGGFGDFGGGGRGNDRRSMFWRTRLCHKFEKYGHCTYGDDCQYAHGLAAYSCKDSCDPNELKKLGGDTSTRKASFEVTPSECPPEVTRAPPPPPPPAATPVEDNDRGSAGNFKWPKKLVGIYADDWI